MVITPLSLLLLILFCVMAVVGAIRGEFKSASYWFYLLVGVVILATYAHL
jgi:hypothetical protein